MEYTESHSLGISIVLLYSVIFVSFLITSLIENKNPLDSILIVSNAFSSNGYAVPETSDIGKINNLVLSWMGVILPGVGTATLTAAILTKHFKKKLNNYEDKFNELNNKLDEFKGSMENLEKTIKENDKKDK